MTEQQKTITLVRLTPQPVVRAYAFGPQPEDAACARMAAYLTATGLAADGQTHRLFGYNSPNPSAGSPNYGYEVVLTGVTLHESEGDSNRAPLRADFTPCFPLPSPKATTM